MKIGIYTNPDRDIECRISRKLIEILRGKNVEFCVCNNAMKYFSADVEIAGFEEAARRSDVIFAFGGDGTMLDVAVRSAVFCKPVFGVNMGKLGFLTECGEQELDFAVNSVLQGAFTVDTRTLLEAETQKGTYYALNEAMFANDDNLHIVTVNVKIDGTDADSVRCDGMIVSTPTGSTAYSLSCNGPILSPDVGAMLITAVCPHTLHSRPIVISDKSTVLLRTDNKDMNLILDGRTVVRVGRGQAVRIGQSAMCARFIRLNKDNFYHRLLQKLSYWGD